MITNKKKVLANTKLVVLDDMTLVKIVEKEKSKVVAAGKK
jgi:hypothetical protein